MKDRKQIIQEALKTENAKCFIIFSDNPEDLKKGTAISDEQVTEFESAGALIIDLHRGERQAIVMKPEHYNVKYFVSDTN